jgi:putative ABC transport system permease protein
MMTNRNSDLAKNYDALKHELLNEGIVESVTVSSSPATDLYWHSDVDHWPGKNAGETIEMATIVVGDDYFETMGLGFHEGREFKGSNDTLNVIFNETAIKKMRLKDPLSQTITWDDKQYRIIGIAKDALMVSPYAPAEPTMYIYTPGTADIILYRLRAGINTSEAIAKLTPIFNKYNPAFPYVYGFTDEAYAAKFKSEQLIGKLSALFAGLTIFISCLGLFGLAAYTAERRTKEIGIRKVLGASIFGIVRMLFKSFLVPVCIATVIAIPVAFWVMSNWLQNYSYRITISPWVFVLAAVVAVLIAAITVSVQSIKAALMNPVRSLKSE